MNVHRCRPLRLSLALHPRRILFHDGGTRRGIVQMPFGNWTQDQKYANYQGKDRADVKSIVLRKMIESGGVTLASVVILGIAGYSYHKYYERLILQKLENAFQPDDPTRIGSKLFETEYAKNWVSRDEQTEIDHIITGDKCGGYYLIVGEKGSGKMSMVMEAMRKNNGEGVAMFEAHGDLEVFRTRMGKAVGYEFYEDYIGSMFGIEGPREKTAMLDIERVFDTLEQVALLHRRKRMRPLVLVINNIQRIRNDKSGQDLLTALQQRAERWAVSGLVTVVFTSRDYWIYERLRRRAKRLNMLSVSDLPKEKAMARLKNYRQTYFGETLSSRTLESVYGYIGGRNSYLNRVARSRDVLQCCRDIIQEEKTWFLSKCWILGGYMDIEELNRQKYCWGVMLLAKELVDRGRAENAHALPEIPFYEALDVVTRGDLMQGNDRDSIFSIDARAMVRAVSVPMQNVFREVCSQPGFDDHLKATEWRIKHIEGLSRVRETTLKDLGGKQKYRIRIQDAEGQRIGTVQYRQ